MILKLKLALMLSTFSLALSLSVYAQQPTAQTVTPPVAATPEAQLLRALLDEVRQLRAAVQRTNINTYRAQRLAERLAQQQNRVDGLSEQIEQIKAQIQQSSDAGRDEEELRELEASISSADPQTRQQLQIVYESLKRSIERQREYARQDAERNRGRQQQLEATLLTEQGRLAELRENWMRSTAISTGRSPKARRASDAPLLSGRWKTARS